MHTAGMENPGDDEGNTARHAEGDLADEDPVFLELAERFAQSLVASGDIHPIDKTGDALLRAAADWVAENDGLEIVPILDYTSTLLNEARKFRDDNQTLISLVLYATYFEHWLNDMVRTRAERLGIDEADINQMLRTSIEAKTGYLWRLLYGKALGPEIAIDIKRIAHERNMFVHYKWRPDSEDGDRRDALVRRADAVVQAATAVTERLS